MAMKIRIINIKLVITSRKISYYHFKLFNSEGIIIGIDIFKTFNLKFYYTYIKRTRKIYAKQNATWFIFVIIK